jgi:hypothetical protein
MITPPVPRVNGRSAGGVLSGSRHVRNHAVPISVTQQQFAKPTPSNDRSRERPAMLRVGALRRMQDVTTPLGGFSSVLDQHK